MGINKSKIVEPESPLPPQHELTVLERWSRSQHSQEDLFLLLKGSSGWSECEQVVSSFLQNINNLEKYQNCISTLLDYFKQDDSHHGLSQIDRKQLFTYYITRYSHSFFVAGDFHQSSINLSLKSKDKLYFIYEYYSVANEQLLEKAILLNFPSIYTEFREFVCEMIERDIIVKKPAILLKFIIEDERLEMIKQGFQEISKNFTRELYEQSMQQLQNVFQFKKLWILGTAQFMKYDNADISSLILGELIRKGYNFIQQDYDYYLKIQLFSMFLYNLEKLSLNFQEFETKKVTEVIQQFYTTKNIEDTPLLLRCFDIFGRKSVQKRREYLLEYCFTPQTHLSLLIRLLQHKYIQFSGSQRQYSGLFAKIVASRCQIGRYYDQIIDIVDGFGFIIEEGNQIRAKKLLKIILCFHVIGLDNVAVQEIYPVTSCCLDIISGQSLVLFQDNCLSLFKMIVKGFLMQSQTITKRIQIEGEEYKLQKLYDFLYFIEALRKYLTGNYVPIYAIHQIIFKELISQEYYLEIQALLSLPTMQVYDITFQSAEMQIIDHIISLLTTRKIKPLEGTLTLLMKILSINPNDPSTHFISAYYKYFKYLQSNDISLPSTIKSIISVQHLYHMMQTYPKKLQNIDFNYLFEQLSCIRQNYNDRSVPFETIITDDYLKFKMNLCKKFFTMKKIKAGNQVLQDVMKYQPPWLSSEVVKILRENPNIDEHFINIAFKHCTRGDDLDYILALHSKKKQSGSLHSKLSLQNIKKFNDSVLKAQKYICLEPQLILSEQYYMDLVAEMTYNKDQTSKSQLKLFFKLLSTEPERAFNYAVNFIKATSFIYNFLLEAVRRNVIHQTKIFPLLLKYFWFKLEFQCRDYTYIKYKEYKTTKIQDIVSNAQKWNERPSVSVEVLSLFKKTIKNYQASLEVTSDFLDLYINESQHFKFLYDQGERKRILLEIRQQPMSKPISLTLQKLCQQMSVDIVELSLYELIGKTNSNEDIDDDSWNIIQKLIYWSDEKQKALKIIKKLSQKIEGLWLLEKILGYMRERQVIFSGIIGEEHLQIISSLAAIERDNNFYGIIPETFFDRPVGIYPTHPRGLLSETHRKILERAGCLTNIFVLSKALYFINGCDQEIEKVVLGQFSLKQQDSQEFQILRKKIKTDSN